MELIISETCHAPHRKKNRHLLWLKLELVSHWGVCWIFGRITDDALDNYTSILGWEWTQKDFDTSQFQIMEAITPFWGWKQSVLPKNRDIWVLVLSPPLLGVGPWTNELIRFSSFVKWGGWIVSSQLPSKAYVSFWRQWVNGLRDLWLEGKKKGKRFLLP